MEVLIGDLRADERILRTLGLGSEVDQVKQRILVPTPREGRGSYPKLWELLDITEEPKTTEELLGIPERTRKS